MNDEMLQENARSLRFKADDLMLQRLRAGVADRISRQDSLWDLLSLWARPVAAALALLVLILGLALTWLSPSPESELLASVSPPPVAEEVYVDVE